MPTLIWMGVNPAGAGTVLVPDTMVVYDVSVVTIMEVEVGASTVMVFKTVEISVKVSWAKLGTVWMRTIQGDQP